MGGGITLKSGTPIKLHGTEGVGIASDDLSWAIPVKDQSKYNDIVQTSNKTKQEVHVKSKKDGKLHKYTAFAVNNEV